MFSFNKRKAALVMPIAARTAISVAVSNRSDKIMKEAIPILEIGFPPPTQVAVANSWHINRYYYEASENQWYLVVDAKTQRTISMWSMRPVDSEFGQPIGEVKNTSVDLWADRFADRPFDVRKEPEEGFDWFRKNFAANKDVVVQLELFDAYNDRLRYCSSYEALVRLGFCSPD